MDLFRLRRHHRQKDLGVEDRSSQRVSHSRSQSRSRSATARTQRNRTTGPTSTSRSSFRTGPIWRVPSTGGQEELVIDEPVHWSNLPWSANGIYYIAVPPTGAPHPAIYGVPGNALKFFRFSDRKTLTIHALPHPAYMGLSVSRDQSQVFLTQVDHQGATSGWWMDFAEFDCGSVCLRVTTGNRQDVVLTGHPREHLVEN